jgi:ribosomal protein L11 methylase PrmA
LTLRKAAWFSSVMTQRSIQLPHHTSARSAARSAAVAHTKQVDIVVANVALAALVLVVVVVLITPFTGAG